MILKNCETCKTVFPQHFDNCVFPYYHKKAVIAQPHNEQNIMEEGQQS